MAANWRARNTSSAICSSRRCASALPAPTRCVSACWRARSPGARSLLALTLAVGPKPANSRKVGMRLRRESARSCGAAVIHGASSSSSSRAWQQWAASFAAQPRKWGSAPGAAFTAPRMAVASEHNASKTRARPGKVCAARFASARWCCMATMAAIAAMAALEALPAAAVMMMVAVVVVVPVAAAAAAPGAPAAWSATTCSVTPMPSRVRGPAIGWSASAARPGASVSRWPARLPLSTDDTYIGCSGTSETVSYQL